MPIVNLSSVSGTDGRAIAERVASRLGCASIEDAVVAKAAAASGLSPDPIRLAIRTEPLLAEMPLETRKRCMAHIQAALTETFLEKDAVFHAPFSHFLVRGVAHLLTVRIHSPHDARIAGHARRAGCSPRQAEREIRKNDRLRLAVARRVFGQDDDDPGHFNLVVNAAQMDAETAVAVISDTARQRGYRPTTYSIGCLRSAALASRAKALLADLDPDATVAATGRVLRVRTRFRRGSETKRREEIQQRLAGLDGFDRADVTVVSNVLDPLP
jgi:cytidylate kinase